MRHPSRVTRQAARLFLLALASMLTGCITINLLPMPGPLKETQIGGSGSAKVLLVELTGLISAQDQGMFEHQNQVARLKEELTRAAEDSDIQAVILRINSPGGTVTASDVIYHEIRAFRSKRKIPIVASIMDIGASGGYYIAAAADKIVVHPSSVTGSIGVIMLTVNAKGLLEKIGMEATAVTSGPKKDMGSPFRHMTDEERTIFQGVIDSMYDRFLTVVRESRRSLTADEVRRLADGRIYSGDQAKAVGLADAVGYLDDAIELAKRQAGLSEARVVAYRRAGEYRPNIYAQAFGGGAAWTGLTQMDVMALVRGGTPQFMYLWMP
jgi:protease-4